MHEWVRARNATRLQRGHRSLLYWWLVPAGALSLALWWLILRGVLAVFGV